ncbi:MAG: o-succinylbenzoate synthase [Ruminococcaceae bacterium]|nr:o-succinylbenzoate synthase [Oscillospiraceae bacterium]
MTIDALDFYYVAHPLKEPWTTAYGSDDTIHSVLTCLTSGSVTAWSESSPLQAPTYSPECAIGVFEIASRFLAPLVLHQSFASAEEVNLAMAPIKGNPFAHAAIEMAWWVLHSKETQKPLHVCLGGTTQPVSAGADFGIQESFDHLIKCIDHAFQAGFQRVKLKVKPGWDLEMLRAVRSTFPNRVFHIDCNAGYSLENDWPFFKAIDPLGLAMIEQPLHYADVIDHAQLQKRMQTPICLDESIHSVYMAEKAIDLGACKFINIKPGRVGGLLHTLHINKLCASAGVGNWIGGMLESAVGSGICIECATLPNMTYPNDLFPSDNYYREELSEQRIELSAPGQMMPSLKPGNPFIPDPEILKKRTIRHVHCE